MASIFSEKHEAVSSTESAGSWKKCKRGEGEEEIWGFLEEGGKQFGKKNVEAGELAGERRSGWEGGAGWAGGALCRPLPRPSDRASTFLLGGLASIGSVFGQA